MPYPPFVRNVTCLILVVLLCQGRLSAGIHIKEERKTLEPAADINEFQKQQLPYLRGYGPPDVTMQGKPTSQRSIFLAKVQALRAKGKLSPDEQADLGGYLLYLKQTSPKQPAYEEAVTVLEAGFRSNPRHFALAANLGTAYQLTGKLDAAERCLQNAVDLAPPLLREMEQLHLRLVQRRLRENIGRGSQPDLDLIFGRPTAPFHFVDANGLWNYGKLAQHEIDKLPGRSVDLAMYQTQQLLVWLPDDGRLHWQLAEFALATGHRQVASDLLHQCVDTFRLSNPQLKLHRALVQESLHWANLLDKLGNARQPEPWIVQTLGQGIAANSLPGGFSQVMLQVSTALPVKKQASDLFNAKDAPVAAIPEAPAKPFVIQPWHWALIVLGSVLGVIMLYWQLHEWMTRLSKKRRPA